MSHADIQRVRELLGRYSSGDPNAIAGLVAREWFTYEPAPDEPTAASVYARFAAELKGAAADLKVDIPDLADSGDGVMAGEAVFSGTWTGELWGASPSGEHYQFRIPVRVRSIGDHFAFEAQLDTPGALAILRELQLVNPPDQMHLPTPHPVVFDDILVKVLFTGQVADRPCSHLADVAITRTDEATCDDCTPDEYLAGAAAVPDLRARRLLRYLHQQARQGALGADRPSAHPLHPYGRGLDVVLRGQCRLREAHAPGDPGRAGRRHLMYMIQQRTTTAVREGYRDSDPAEVAQQLEEARRARAWLEGLQVDADVRAWLVEPIAAVEEALAEIDRRHAASADRQAG